MCNCQTNVDGRWIGRGEHICPRAHYWLLITAFSPETPSACSFTYLRLSLPPPFLLLHYWFTARGGSSSSATLVTNQGLQWAHPFSLCSFTTGLPLLLLLLLLSALTYIPRQAGLSLPFLHHSLPFSSFSGIFRSVTSLACVFSLLWNPVGPSFFERYLAKMFSIFGESAWWSLLSTICVQLFRRPKAGSQGANQRAREQCLSHWILAVFCWWKKGYPAQPQLPSSHHLSKSLRTYMMKEASLWMSMPAGCWNFWGWAIACLYLDFSRWDSTLLKWMYSISAIRLPSWGFIACGVA